MATKIFTMLMLLFSVEGAAAPLFSSSKNTQVKIEELDGNLKNIRVHLKDFRHELSNQENEIQIFNEKLINQESILDQIRQDFLQDLNGQESTIRNQKIELLSKIEASRQEIVRLENIVEHLTNDLRLLKDQSNEAVKAIEKNHKQLKDQDKQIQNIEAALHSMADLIKASNQYDTKQEGRLYKVQPGDSLGKIAIEHKVSIEALRKANPKIVNDKIIIGQNLSIPY
jgi:chromosome segregation ATPase